MSSPAFFKKKWWGCELRLTKSQTEWVADAGGAGINLPSVAATLALPTWVLPVIGLGLMTQARIATSYGKCLGFNIIKAPPTTWVPVPLYYSCKG